MEYADFLSAMFIALSECTQWAVIDRALLYEKIRLAGKISEVYSKNIVVAIMENSTVSVGDTVYLRGDNYCYSAKILSLEENDNNIESKTVLSPMELGLRFDAEPKMSGEIYYFNLQPPSRESQA